MQGNGEDGRHPIQVVVRRSGLSADVLRAWEKRYGAVRPERSATGRRLYSDADIDRLKLIREVIAAGRRIGDVANLEIDELAAMVEEDRAQTRSVAPRPGGERGGDDFVNAGLNAVRAFDALELRAVLNRALISLSPHDFIDDVASPLMQMIGDMWVRGELRPGHEHLATDVMRTVLGEMLETLQPKGGAPQLIVATPSGQRHSLGALLVGAAACLEGWAVTYLGADLPGADIAEAIVRRNADAVALSITVADPAVETHVAAIRKRVGPELPILVGGQGAEGLTNAGQLGVTRLRGVSSLRAVLNSLQAATR